jgi:hypothetical protein
MTQLGFGRNRTTAFQRVVLSFAAACVTFPISFAGAEAACKWDPQRHTRDPVEAAQSLLDECPVKDRGHAEKARPCEWQQAAEEAASQRLQATDYRNLCESHAESYVGRPPVGCSHALEDFYRASSASQECEDRQRKKDQEARDAADASKRAADERKYEERRTALSKQIHNFIDAVRIGMTATEADAAEREAFHNQVWGKTVNTTVTGDGTTQQWVYRFSKAEGGASDMYVYLHDGVVFAIQK